VDFKKGKYSPIGTFRQRTESWENEYLSERAMRSSNSEGRLREEEQCPLRTVFQRDRDRILHSKAFRRLKHKTQVFIAPEGDHYRTRLTHTLEVSAIARTAATALRLNDSLTEAIALGHDLGHPPFGHAGEKYLDLVMRERGFDPGFLHNIQSLRVVDKIENDGRGLNLTMETRDGIQYHTKGMDDISSSLSEGQLPNTEEGRLVRIADRVAYLYADLEDAIRAGLVDRNNIPVLFDDSLRENPSNILNRILRQIVDYSHQAGWVSIPDETVSFMNDMKDFLLNSVYNHQKVIEREPQVKMLIFSLFGEFEKNMESYNAYIGMQFDSEERRLRNICDYISGMTDQYAIMIFEKMFVPGIWEQV
jgi:dGTPase